MKTALKNVMLPTLFKVVNNSWVSLEPFSVILSGGQPKMYWWLYCTGASKSHEIAHICCQIQGQHIQWKFFQSDDSVSIWSWPPVKFMMSRETQEYWTEPAIRCNNVEQYCRQPWTMWPAKHCSMLFSSGQNRLCVFCCVGDVVQTGGGRRRGRCYTGGLILSLCSIVARLRHNWLLFRLVCWWWGLTCYIMN